MRPALLAIMLTLAAAPLLAADAPPPSRRLTDLQACRALPDAAARLACYDKAVEALSAAAASSDVVIVERQDVRKARKGLFGFTLPKIGFLTGKPDNADDQADEAVLETTVISSRSIGYGKWRFTVEGGAIWETVEALMGFDDPLPGKKILLERGALGSYFAKVGKGARVRARRIG